MSLKISVFILERFSSTLRVPSKRRWSRFLFSWTLFCTLWRDKIFVQINFFLFFLSAVDRASLGHSAILYCLWVCHSCASSSGTSLGNMSLCALAHGTNETRPIISTMWIFRSISWTVLSLLERPLCFLAYPLLINEGPSSKDELSERGSG